MKTETKRRGYTGSPNSSRRRFVAGTGAAGLAAMAAPVGRAAETPKIASGLSFGCSAVAWGNEHPEVFLSEISSAGYHGIQLRPANLKVYESGREVRFNLQQPGLTFVSLSAGAPGIDPSQRKADVDRFVAHATFAKEAGALGIEATSPLRGATPTPAQLKSFAETLSEIGKRTSALELPLVFRPQLGQMVQSLEELELIIKSSEPQHVKLALDPGYFVALGVDPVKAIATHAKRLALVHATDVREGAPAPGGKKTFESVELGQGKVDFPAVFAALKANAYAGWVIVSMDRVAQGRTPKAVAADNRKFLRTLGS